MYKIWVLPNPAQAVDCKTCRSLLGHFQTCSSSSCSKCSWPPSNSKNPSSSWYLTTVWGPSQDNSKPFFFPGRLIFTKLPTCKPLKELLPFVDRICTLLLLLGLLNIGKNSNMNAWDQINLVHHLFSNFISTPFINNGLTQFSKLVVYGQPSIMVCHCLCFHRFRVVIYRNQEILISSLGF